MGADIINKRIHMLVVLALIGVSTALYLSDAFIAPKKVDVQIRTSGNVALTNTAEDHESQRHSLRLSLEAKPPQSRESQQRLQRFLSVPTVYWPQDVNDNLKRGDLPALYDLLDDETDPDKWSYAIAGITVLEEPHKALDVIIGHIHNTKKAARLDPLLAELPIESAFFVGWLEPEVGEEFLLKALDKAGAREILKGWETVPLLDGEPFDERVRLLRISAAEGLLFYRNRNSFEPVTNAFLELESKSFRALSFYDRLMLLEFAGFLAYNDFIEDKGMNAYVSLRKGPDEEFQKAIISYKKPYLERIGRMARYGKGE